VLSGMPNTPRCDCNADSVSAGATTCVAKPAPCAGIDCSGHGSCAVAGTMPVCVCEAGFRAGAGNTCEAVVVGQECQGIDCSGHGTCAVAGGAPLCSCEAGYDRLGTTCVARAVPDGGGGGACAGVTCSGRGQCAVLGGSTPICVCNPGYVANSLACVVQGGTAGGGTAGGGTAGTNAVVEVSRGRDFTCARRASGGVLCWGWGSNGQLGIGNPSGGDRCAVANLDPAFLYTCRTRPVAVSGLTDAVEISAGEFHACARRSSGSVVCWGTNGGALGDGTTTQRLTPTPVSGLPDAVEISTGAGSSCARRSGGSVVCWGDNNYGQLGDGTTTQRLTPTAVSGLTDAVEISAGDSHACARQSSGTVVCWGLGFSGQLGLGTPSGGVQCAGVSGSVFGTTCRTQPVAVSGLTDAIEIFAGGSSTCARRSSGSVVCWGNNAGGALGDGTIINRLTPTAVSGLTDAVEIGGGKFHRCARQNGGSLVCWGDNDYGQVGDDTTTDRLVPTPVYDPRADGPLTGIARLGRGGIAQGHTCAQRTDGTLLCWGKNNVGAVGDGTFLNRTAPKAVSGL